MQCHYFESGVCRSCTLLATPYADQLAGKQAHARSLLPSVPTGAWEPSAASPEEGFRNKAKMVVAGTLEEPTFGILAPDGTGVDLRACGLHEPALRDVLPALADLVVAAGLTPYDVAARRGELKHLLVTRSPDGELMVRLVLRSTESRARVEKHLPQLLAQVPLVRVLTLNLQPDHKAVLEGEREIVLTEAATLPMRVGTVTLHLRPQGFFQTNTTIAAELYVTARDWTDGLDVASVLDLYCGVGGFALHLARPGRSVTGVEVSAEAVEGARLSASGAGLDAVFEVGDATAYAEGSRAWPDLVVVNPPRRGIGPLAAALETSSVRYVLYSSCRAESLAADLAAMPSLVPQRARILDMFPQTHHYETLVLLSRGPIRQNGPHLPP